MQRLFALIGVALLVGCGFAQPSSALQSNKHELNFKSDTGGFAVWLPAKIEQNDEIRARTCISTTRDVHFFFARSNGAYWLVQYCQLSEDEMK
jgi:hypothetical protein